MIYTVYAKEDNITFIMEEEIYEGKTLVSVVGFYYGEPNDADTKEFRNSLTATIE